MSSSATYPDGRYPICKKCLFETLDMDNTEQIQDTLLEMNKPFIYSQWMSSLDEGKQTNKNPFGLYIKNLFLNYKNSTWKDSEFDSPKKEIVPSKSEQPSENVEYEIIDNIEDSQDKKDVIKMLGYDPFEYEAIEDQKQMYSRLVDFLDESTLEDGLKLQSVIEIVKGFNQVDKVNRAITLSTKDLQYLSQNYGGIKSLADTKQKMLTSVLKLAEENGISIKHNNQKSKGAGTLSGIIKQIQEKGIREAEINIYDIETYEGMRKVADISNKSIMEQLMLNENDYTEMIKDQRDMINNYESRLNELEEENRLLKLKIKEYEE